MLRTAAQGVYNALLRAPAAAGQRRAAGDLPFKPNKYIEEWAARRETIEEHFVFDATALRRTVTWVFGFPLLVYTTVVTEFHEDPKNEGKPRMRFLGYDD